MGGSSQQSQQEPKKENVIVEATALKPVYLTGVEHTTHSLVTVRTQKQDKEHVSKRQPIEIALVLDRSGSMSGDRINNARKAVKEVLAVLKPEDRAHFVAYDHDVNVVFSKESGKNKEALQKKVDSVETGGSTNIGGALQKAYEILEESDFDGLRRVFLFSDGKNNAGPLRSTSDFVNLVKRAHDTKNINTSAFGIGDGFNEELMTAIAESGEGDYFFIQASKDITRVTSEAMRFFTTTCGKDAVLCIRGLNGSIATKAYGHDDTTAVKLGYLYFDDEKTVLVEHKVSLSDQHKDATPVLSVCLQYTNVDTQEKCTVQKNVTVKTTESVEEAREAEDDPEVALALGTQKVAEEEERALELLNEGKVEEAKQAYVQSATAYRSCLASNITRASPTSAQYYSKQEANLVEGMDMLSAAPACASTKKNMAYRCKQKKTGWKGYGFL